MHCWRNFKRRHRFGIRCETISTRAAVSSGNCTIRGKANHYLKIFRMKTLVTLLLCWAAVSVHADRASGRLNGSYCFHGQTLIDPPPGEPQDTHLGFILEGEAARDLYRRLTVKAETDPCLDDGSLSKTQGGIRCTELAGKSGWRCEFAIRLDQQTVIADGAC
jgi:hypothetical protein